MPENQAPSSLPTILSVLVLMGLIGYAIYNKIDDKKTPAVTTPFNSLAYLTIAKEERGEAPVYGLDIEYPEFKGLGKTKDEALNATISGTIESEVVSFKKGVAEVVQSASVVQPSSLYVRYKVKEANEKIMNIIF